MDEADVPVEDDYRLLIDTRLRAIETTMVGVDRDVKHLADGLDIYLHSVDKVPMRLALVERGLENLQARHEKQEERQWQLKLALIVSGLSVILSVATAIIQAIK